MSPERSLRTPFLLLLPKDFILGRGVERIHGHPLCTSAAPLILLSGDLEAERWNTNQRGHLLLDKERTSRPASREPSSPRSGPLGPPPRQIGRGGAAPAFVTGVPRPPPRAADVAPQGPAAPPFDPRDTPPRGRAANRRGTPAPPAPALRSRRSWPRPLPAGPPFPAPATMARGGRCLALALGLLLALALAPGASWAKPTVRKERVVRPDSELGERPPEDNQSFQYDHEAFLGKEDSKTFDQLTSEESKERLG